METRKKVVEKQLDEADQKNQELAERAKRLKAKLSDATTKLAKMTIERKEMVGLIKDLDETNNKIERHMYVHSISYCLVNWFVPV